YNLSYRYVGRREEAEDLTQEIMVRVYQNLGSYRPDAGSFQNWVLRVGRNLIIDHYRRNRRFAGAGGSEELETMNLGDTRTPSPQQAAEQAETARFVRAGLESLSPELREAVILRDLEGMEYREIALLLRVPEGTVKSRINRGRIELARLLGKRRAAGGGGVQEG
ncbi:MAG: sigma-70 family RNA polymerase sigma factor, partial [Acidobacteria bacterium]|nr:sigma-70 family RNA polymerase sigma factor [Acidobacteriota bacterium]